MPLRTAGNRRLPASLWGIVTAGALALVLGPAAAHAQRGILPQSQQERAELTLSDWNPPTRLSCTVQELPYVLPNAAELVDLDALSADLAALAAARDRQGAYVLVSVGYSATGRPDDFHLIESTISDDALAEEIAQLVDQRLYRLAPDEPFGVRLRILLSDEPVVDVGRREECYPRWAEAPSIGTLDVDPGFDFATELAVQNRSAVRIYMNAEGDVDDAYALGSIPSAATLGELVSATRSARLNESALLDRRPMGFWFTVYAAERGVRTASTYYPTTIILGSHYRSDPYHSYFGGRYGYYYDSYTGLYCRSIYRGSFYGCDPRYNGYHRIGYPRYYGTYAWFGYGGLGWYGAIPGRSYPSYPYYRPPGRTRPTTPPPGVVIPPPNIPPVRPGLPDRPVILAGRPIDGGNSGGGSRGPRTVQFRPAPDAGEVSSGIRTRQPIARETTSGFVRPSEPAAGSRPIPERTRPSAPVIRRPAATSNPAPERPRSASERSRPTAPSRAVPGTVRPAPEPSRPAPGAERGAIRPAPESTRPSAPPRATERPAAPEVIRPRPRPAADDAAREPRSAAPRAIRRDPAASAPVRVERSTPPATRPRAASGRPAPTARQPAERPAVQRPPAQASRPAAQRPAVSQPSRPAAQRPAASQPSRPAAQRPAASQPSRPAAQRPAASQASRPAAQRPPAQASRPASAPARTVRPASPPPSRPAASRPPASRASSGGGAVRPSRPPGGSPDHR